MNAYNFSVSFTKGSNNLTVVGKNVVNSSPAGIIYKVVQTQDCNTTSNSTTQNSDSNDQALAIGISVPVLVLC